MKQLFFLILLLVSTTVAFCQNPVGRWQKVSHISVFENQQMDSYKALLQQRPCAANIVYEINADYTFRLTAAESGCDENYKNIQQKLYSKTRWKVSGGKITISTLKDFSVGQTYRISITGNTMTWEGTDGQGTIRYRRL